MNPGTSQEADARRRRQRLTRTWARLLVWLWTLGLAYGIGARLGYRRGQRALPAVIGRESQPEMIGTHHPWWEIERVIGAQKCNRRVGEIILHHTWQPTAAEYVGEPTVEAILRYHAKERGWHNIAYHYLIAPDGTVWLGRPLGQDGTHTIGHNQGTIGVCLIVNADHEQPSELQIKATALVLRTLLARFHLSAKANFAPGHGFHRDYADKTCPGTLITKQRVLAWLRAKSP